METFNVYTMECEIIRPQTLTLLGWFCTHEGLLYSVN